MDKTVKLILGESNPDQVGEFLAQIRKANLALNDEIERRNLVKELGPLIYQIHSAEEKLSNLLLN